MWWRFTPGGGLGGLAQGYCHVAPSGHRKGEPLLFASEEIPGIRKVAELQEVAGVRVIGKPACGDNPQQAFSSCAELQAFAD